MSKGEGIKGAFPPLAKSDYLMEDKDRSIRILLQGLNEKIIVNEQEYSMAMPKQDYLNDRQIADVLNYVRNSWGNEGKAVTPEEVKKSRDQIKSPK
jgi:nitrite reductase (NO-forming)